LNKIRKFLAIKSNWAYCLMFCVLLVAYIVGFFNERFSYIAIGGFFLFIAIESFIKNIGYFEDMKLHGNIAIKQLESLAEPINNIEKFLLDGGVHGQGILIRKTNNRIGDLNILLQKAKKDVFIIGGSMTPILACYEIIQNISSNKNIIVRMLAVNMEDEKTRCGYYNVINANRNEGNTDNLTHLKRFLISNVEIRTSEIIPTTYYFAIDIDQPDGFIEVMHIVSGRSESDYPHIEINRNNKEWYDVYQSQIKALWNAGTKWG